MKIRKEIISVSRIFFPRKLDLKNWFQLKFLDSNEKG